MTAPTLAERLTLMVRWVAWLRARGVTPAETLALVRLRNRVAGRAGVSGAEANRRWRAKAGARTVSCEARYCTYATQRKPGDTTPYECPRHRGTNYDPKRRNGPRAPRRRKHGQVEGWTRASGLCGNNLHPMTPENTRVVRENGRPKYLCRVCLRARQLRYQHRSLRTGTLVLDYCIARGCDAHTMRRPEKATGYLCREHRANPPAWLSMEQRNALGARVKGALPERYRAAQAPIRWRLAA